LGVGVAFSGFGVGVALSGFGVVGGFSGLGVGVVGTLPGFSSWPGFSVVLGVGVAFGGRVGLGVGVALPGLGVGVVPTFAGCSDSERGVLEGLEGLCVPRFEEGVAVGTGVGVTAGVALRPKSQSKKERFFGFGVGSGAVSGLTNGAGVLAALVFGVRVKCGFSPLPVVEVSSGLFSPAAVEVDDGLSAGETSWAERNAAQAPTATTVVRTGESLGMVEKW
jgi:hypothetical protein